MKFREAAHALASQGRTGELENLLAEALPHLLDMLEAAECWRTSWGEQATPLGFNEAMDALERLDSLVDLRDDSPAITGRGAP